MNKTERQTINAISRSGNCHHIFVQDDGLIHFLHEKESGTLVDCCAATGGRKVGLLEAEYTDQGKTEWTYEGNMTISEFEAWLADTTEVAK